MLCHLYLTFEHVPACESSESRNFEKTIEFDSLPPVETTFFVTKLEDTAEVISIYVDASTSEATFGIDLELLCQEGCDSSLSERTISALEECGWVESHD